MLSNNKQTVDLGKERLYSKGWLQEAEKDNKENALWDLKTSQWLRKTKGFYFIRRSNQV